MGCPGGQSVAKNSSHYPCCLPVITFVKEKMLYENGKIRRKAYLVDAVCPVCHHHRLLHAGAHPAP
jgi:hypothetical protein